MRLRWRRHLEDTASVILAVLLHVAVAVVLWIAFQPLQLLSASAPAADASKGPQPIAAVVVSDSQIKAEEQRLASQDAARKAALQAAEQKRQQAEQQAAALERKRHQEQQQLAALEAQQEKVKRQREQAQKQAQQAEQQRQQAEQAAQQAKEQAAAAARRTAAAKHQAEQAKKQAQEAAKQRAAEEAARKAAEAARKAAEAKREQAKKAAEEAKRKAEEAKKARQRQAAEAARKAAEAKRKAAEQKARQQLADSLRAAAHQRELSNLVAQYTRLIKQRVEHNWLLPSNSQHGLQCLLNIQLDPLGNVTSVKVVNSSGDPAFDRSAVAAVHRASPLPLPDDPQARAQFQSFNFKFNPEG